MPRPNLLFIMCDQLRYDCVGFAKKYGVSTPNIDRLAAGGVWFDNAYTPIPVCAPARQSLFSGLRPEKFGGLWNFGITHPVRQIPEGAFTYPQALHGAGWRTAFLGKWNVSDTRLPQDFGFDRYVSDGEICAVQAKYPPQEYKNGSFGEPCGVPLGDSHTHTLAHRASELIGEFAATGGPWYIHVDYPEPHLPCRPSAPFDTMYSPAEMQPWGGFYDTFEGKPYIARQQVINWHLEDRGWDEWAGTVAMYFGVISQLDDSIGMMIRTLERLNLMKDTLVVFTCDHGDLCGSHRMIDKHYVMYEDLVHVPLIYRWDGALAPGRFGGYVHNTLDTVPTLLDLLGVPQPAARLHGGSLRPALTQGAAWERDCAVSSYNGQQFGLFSSRSIKTDGWKYVWNLTDVDELYDLYADPYELRNAVYAPANAGVLASLRRRLHAELQRCEDPMLGWVEEQLLLGRKI